MAEIRLNKLLRQFNIGLDDLVGFLHQIGVEVDNNPNAKVSDEYLPDLFKQFGKERDLKDAAERVEAKIAEILEKNKRRLNPNEGDSSNSSEPSKNKELDLKLSPQVKPEDFDWDAFERNDVFETSRNSTFSLKAFENEVVEGEVTAVNKREVVVTIGGKSEGVIPVSEFRYDPDIKVGDKVEVYVESAEDKKGQLVLSHRKARTLKSWDRVNEAFENDEIVKGFVKTRTKGGMIVDVFGIEAFLPGSQIDIKPIRDYDQFVGQNIDCKIVKINQEFRNVVVSRRILLEPAQAHQDNEIQRENNLAIKQAIIEDLKTIVEGREDISTQFPAFRELQNLWRETGPVPDTAFREINDTYYFYVEKFYDMVKVKRDLRDLDFRKNLEAKVALCEAAEKLAESPDVTSAYKKLQKLHEQWKEYGPVAKEYREDVWNRFKAASSIINHSYRESFKTKGPRRGNHGNYPRNDSSKKIISRDTFANEHRDDVPSRSSHHPTIDPSTIFNEKALAFLKKK